MKHSRRSAALVLSALLTLCATGCSSLPSLPSWSSLNPFAEDDKDDSPAPLKDYKREANIDVKWDSQVGDGAGSKYLLLQPAVEGDRVFAADGYGVVEAFDKTSGKRLWHTTIGHPAARGFVETLRFWAHTDRSFVSGAIGAGDGAAFAATTKGEVVALDGITGKELWRARVNAEVAAPPETDGDIVAVLTLDGKLVALDRATGQNRWSYDTQVPILSLRGAARPTFAEGAVIGAFPSGHVAALKAKTGEPIWDTRIAIPQGRSELDRVVDVDGTPAVDGDAVYAASYQGRIKALKLLDGTPLWEREFSSHQAMAVNSSALFAIGKEDHVFALDKQSNVTTWDVDVLKNRGLTSPALLGDYVVVGDADGYMHVLAQSDGRIVARTKIDGDGLRSDFVVADDVLYGQSNGGELFAVKIHSSK